MTQKTLLLSSPLLHTSTQAVSRKSTTQRKTRTAVILVLWRRNSMCDGINVLEINALYYIYIYSENMQGSLKMEYSNESIRYPEERRLTSSKFLELHVLFVPDEQWNLKLNKVPVEATESFISAGFIRVYPEITLRALRNELGVLLGAERDIQKFSFLKCVGRNLALVKAKQERDLKVKSFAPPYATQPELYLLPIVESDDSVCSQSLSPDNYSTSTAPQTYSSARLQVMPTGTKGHFKFPLIPKGPQQPPSSTSQSPNEAVSRLGEEKEVAEEEESYSSAEENEEELRASENPKWAKNEPPLRESYVEETSVPVTEIRSEGSWDCLLQKKSVMLKAAVSKSETPVKQHQRSKWNGARDSGIPESLEDRESVFPPSQDRFRKSKDVQKLNCLRNKPKHEVPEHPVPVATFTPNQYDFPTSAQTQSNLHTTAPTFLTSRDELMEEIRMAKEERKQLEHTRQELLRKGKDLLAQNRRRRNQARDSWKRRYFETKKATAPLEVTLRSLRQELEKFYSNLLHQLQARDGKGKTRRQGRMSSIKNELIIQILTESHEIDNLKRKLDDDNMKLVTEIKLRKQAATELRALKTELAQKKTQMFLSGPMGSLDLREGGKDRT
ncbi:hypothetical protein DPEC_G00271550 [Dallia pectoralis]|uniref:Uncharacterized protein n=1 Tax=Dallia pectoralis TaxID=75939 RepID=A0ACC2FPK4_DALPE|nr:hypothetical protein DPEC_G00271550 [Dallia pectoralis]